MRKTKSLLLLIVIPLMLLSGCKSCSRVGRAEMIATAMAKNQAKITPTTPSPNTINRDKLPKVVDIDDVVTTKEKEIINTELIKKKYPPAEGKLIQVEGLVLKEVTELTIKLGVPNSQIGQIFAMRDYVFSNWHYIFDPKTDHDTFRSAEATISLKYKNKYPGDCDDYAILMASFARQIGLQSRMVGAYANNGSGHAFAEFLIPEDQLSNPELKGKDYIKDKDGIWISLDWFQGTSHNRYNRNIHIYDDI